MKINNNLLMHKTLLCLILLNSVDYSSNIISQLISLDTLNLFYLLTIFSFKFQFILLHNF